MSRNLRFQGCSAVTPRKPESPCGHVVGKQWEQMVVELLASCDNRPPAVGEIDELAIAQYISNACSAEERAEIEEAAAESLELSECIALATEAVARTEAAA